MSLFNFDGVNNPTDYQDDDMDFEYSDEFIYEDEFGEADRYYL